MAETRIWHAANIARGRVIAELKLRATYVGRGFSPARTERLTLGDRPCILCISDMHSLLISHADPRPMYLQIMEQIRHRIAVGDWPAGQELPSIRALAARSQVSVITVKRAYLELERDGVIVTRQGKGSFVADTADLSTRLRRAGARRTPGRGRRHRPQLGLSPTSSRRGCGSMTGARRMDTSHDRAPHRARRRRESASASSSWRTSRCASRPGRSWASSAPTAPASRRRSAC